MERGPFFCVWSYKNDIRQHGVISMFSRITSDTHVPFKNFGGHGTVHFFGTKKKTATHITRKRELTVDSGEVDRWKLVGLLLVTVTRIVARFSLQARRVKSTKAQ